MMPESLTSNGVPVVSDLPLPPFDPLGLPVPAWILLALAYLTFTLHLFAMNFTLGSVILALWTRWRKKEGYGGAARYLGTAAPLGFSYLVTFGIPPLLFLQVIYGQFFYSSSVLVGAFWISVIPLLIVAYGHLYGHKLTRDSKSSRQFIILGIALLAMLAIGFIYVNNLTLSMTPERWLDHYAAHPGGGALNEGEPTVWPRYLLFLSPALFTAGLGLVLRGTLLVKWGQESEGRTSQVLGVRAGLIGALLVATGAGAVLATLPQGIRGYVVGGPMTGPAATAAVLGIASLVMAWLSVGKARLSLPVSAAVVAFLAMVCLVVVRDHVRREYLASHFDLSAIPMNPQWLLFAVFVGSLVAGLVFLIVMTVKVASNLVRGYRDG